MSKVKGRRDRRRVRREEDIGKEREEGRKGRKGIGRRWRWQI